MLRALVAFLLLSSPLLAADPIEVPLWEKGAPGFESRKDKKEVRDVRPNGEYRVTNVHNPTLTVILPSKEKATGAAVVILPGGGHVLAAFTSYSLEKRLSSTPERFGRGAIEGVAAPESANNAAAQTSFIPLLTLGLPAHPVMALLVGAFIILFLYRIILRRRG